MHLKEFEFTLVAYPTVPPINPFQNWTSTAATQSLDWYHAYNQTKHDRDSHFDKATLYNCIKAVVANLVLYTVRFGPELLTNQGNTFSTTYKQHFDAKLINPKVDSFYVHKIDLPTVMRQELCYFDPVSEGITKPFKVNPLIL